MSNLLELQSQLLDLFQILVRLFKNILKTCFAISLYRTETGASFRDSEAVLSRLDFAAATVTFAFSLNVNPLRPAIRRPNEGWRFSFRFVVFHNRFGLF